MISPMPSMFTIVAEMQLVASSQAISMMSTSRHSLYKRITGHPARALSAQC